MSEVGKQRSKKHIAAIRYLKNAVALLVIAAIALSAHLFYRQREPQLRGATAGEKFQSLAKIVSEKYRETAVVYVESPDGPLFIVSSLVPSQEIVTQEDMQEVLRQLLGAVAMVLKVTAVEILPEEPSIQYVGMTIVFGGKIESYYAVAEELKAIPEDAEQRVWLSTLRPVGGTQEGSPPEPPPSP